MTRVLAVDPGPHVGIARYTDTPEQGAEWVEWEETPARFYDVVAQWVEWADVVVCENFFISGSRASSANETIEMIGVLRYACRQEGTQFVTQSPAEAKMFSTNEKLKRIGWWRPAKTDHARSATRHLLVYLVKNHRIESDRVLPSAQEVDNGTG